MRFLKAVHGWLGFLIMPWILMIGLTGLFLNHEGLVMGFLSPGGYDEAQFDSWPDPKPMTVEEAQALAGTLLPGKKLEADTETTYHNRKAASFRNDEDQVIVALKTGHYWVKTAFTRTTHAPDGQVLEKKIYWDGLFKWLHVHGWPGRALGTWLSDLTAAAMVVFGLSGVILFLVPRVRRYRNRKQRRTQA